MKKIILLVFFIIVSCSNKNENLVVEVNHYEMTNNDYLLIDYINNYRAENNLNQLQFSQHQSDVSYTQSVYMATNFVNNHDNFQFRANQFPNHIYAECVSYNYSTPYAIFYAYKNSPQHNVFLLGDFISIGTSYQMDQNNKIHQCVNFVK